MAKFVIVVDAQRDFMTPDGALYVGGADALIGPMNDWLGTLDPADTSGVLLTFDTHYAETYAATAEAAQFPIHCVRGEVPSIDRDGDRRCRAGLVDAERRCPTDR
jgi:nicotinamidase-related amidase